MSFKPNQFVPGLILRPEEMVVTSIFNADIPVAPSKKTFGFSGSLQWRSNVSAMIFDNTFIKWDLHVVPLLEKIYTVDQYAHHILHIMSHIEYFP